MACSHCSSAQTRKRVGTTASTTLRFACHSCGRRFNERGTI
jgi:transposase-like protein